jgi:FtsP/CotA-like multicopper oxidase with cupredoxin domain
MRFDFWSRNVTYAVFLLASFFAAGSLSFAFGQSKADNGCFRGAPGSVVPEPADLRSHDGQLKVELRLRSSVDSQGQARYCYVDQDGNQSPTLRVKPGDRVTLRLHNELPASAQMHGMAAHPDAMEKDCANSTAAMSASSTNLHFHGIVIPPACHQDDVLHTVVEPSAAPFEYSFQIPADQSPGLYWYHPHVHGFSKAQILGGASGALIVEGIETVNSEVSGLPERVFVIRDQELMNPNAAPVQTDSMPPPQVLRDAEGDVLNNGTGAGKPAKDLSMNYVTVPFPQYPPALITMKPQEKQLWRVVNASSITYLELQVLFKDRVQTVGIVAWDGAPINENGNHEQVTPRYHVRIPPGGRAEFIVKAPKEGIPASLVTRSVDTGPGGENDPTRPLATIVTSADATETRSRLPVSPATLVSPHSDSLRNLTPVRQRKLFFSERPQDPKDPKSPTLFYLTVDGKTPTLFDPSSPDADIVVKQGDVEDWIIENRTNELHDFHIHQLHFELLEWNGVPIDEPYLKDTVNVAYWDGHSPVYPSVKLRMDFRDPSIVGTFVYHCHLLEHEDGGMMGTIRVEARDAGVQASRKSTGNHAQQ